MPQNSIFDQPEESLVIFIDDMTWLGDPGFKVTIRQKRHREEVRTTSIRRYAGLECDFMLTMAKDVVAAWLYGQHRDVARAAEAVHRQARAHARVHEAS